MTLFAIVIIFLGFYLANRHFRDSFKPAPECKPHKWVLRFDNSDKRGYLTCKDCGKIPGED